MRFRFGAALLVGIGLLPLAAVACTGGDDNGGGANNGSADGSPTPDSFDYKS